MKNLIDTIRKNQQPITEAKAVKSLKGLSKLIEDEVEGLVELLEEDPELHPDDALETFEDDVVKGTVSDMIMGYVEGKIKKFR